MPPKKKNKSPDNTCSTDVQMEEPQQSTQEAIDQFERELHWCIDQLQLGLETQNPDSKKAQEAVKVLKILTSSKAPLIKKRQAMRNTFGDYRKKMEEEDKKSTAIAKKMKLSKAESAPEASKFFKKSSALTDQKKSEPLGQSTDISNSFMFNFNISDDLLPGNNSTKENLENTKLIDKNKHEQTSVQTIIKDNLNCKSQSSDPTEFKFKISKNDFRFNFSVKDET